MWNIPSKERLSKIPKLNETEHIPIKDKLVHLHFFLGGCDWYVTEYDGLDLFFGFVILNEDHFNSEWGYFSFRELKTLKVNGWLEIDCESEDIWKIRKASEIKNIKTY
jgi:hypothetical protein